jgi:hypothetical protein
MVEGGRGKGSGKRKAERGKKKVRWEREKKKMFFFKKKCGTLAYIKYYLYFCTLI